MTENWLKKVLMKFSQQWTWRFGAGAEQLFCHQNLTILLVRSPSFQLSDLIQLFFSLVSRKNSRIISFYWSSITRFANARKIASSHPRRYLRNFFLPNSHFNKLFLWNKCVFAIASQIIVTVLSKERWTWKELENSVKKTSGMQSLGGRWWLDNHSWGHQAMFASQ